LRVNQDGNALPLAQRREGVARPELRQRQRAFAKGPVWWRRPCADKVPVEFGLRSGS